MQNQNVIVKKQINSTKLTVFYCFLKKRFFFFGKFTACFLLCTYVNEILKIVIEFQILFKSFKGILIKLCMKRDGFDQFWIYRYIFYEL